MTTNDRGATGKKAEQAMTELEAILAEQVRQARQGKLRELESSVAAAGKLIESCLARASGLGADARAQRVLRLYDELCLILKAQKAEAGETLEHLRRGKLSVRAYQPGPP